MYLRVRDIDFVFFRFVLTVWYFLFLIERHMIQIHDKRNQYRKTNTLLKNREK